MEIERENREYPKKRGRAGFWISTSLAIFFFMCCIVLFFSLMAVFVVKGSLTPSDEERGTKKLAEVVVEGSGQNKIVIIPIKGVITAQSTKNILIETPSLIEVVKKQLEQAREDNSVKAIILDIDSPGGGITASDIIYKEILAFKEKTEKKVIVIMRDVAASGAYYISAAADRIIAHPTTITGSIGVIMPLVNFADLAKKYGVAVTSIKSGDMKDIGSPFKEMSDEEREVLDSIVDEMYTRFLQIISDGRSMKIEEVRELADGRIFTGSQAVENGLVDQLGYIEDTISVAKEMAGLEEAKIIKYKRMFDLAELFAVTMKNFSGHRSITLDLHTMAGEDNFPRLMYMWTGYQHDYKQSAFK
ncbi:MAG: signal peptide peptidase SppA [Candidatus Scalindua sp. AMX11]|nr:MAG: signal peptide peptidase SppA [Candidatus Scalindua sp.]NOG85293.1 signal peptide peptidase SppA [Planctomycetota bacterium]RZV81488.1 MAG: signal peptide peptidase SppA [Candidatus Scalindua sp. SCAELEC01]TDE65438.1 MAG: signal peptide peptidase SppA [Candidatus Scalindua sp. AMX11]GJQ59361.1 MAG: serine protease [Candidatus Scalindua sp.]